MKIVGIDPGFDRLGLAAIERVNGKDAYIASECFIPPKSKDQKVRLLAVFNRLCEFLDEHKPEVISLEALYFGVNEKTALTVGEARGVILLACAQRNIPVFEYNPMTIKLSVTGYGKSDKEAVSRMVPKLIKLPAKKMIDDEMDAIAIALTHSPHTH